MRYRVSASVHWEFESEGDPMKEAADRLRSLLPEGFTASKFVVRAGWGRDKKSILGVFSPEDVLPFVGQGRKKIYTCAGKEYAVKMTSDRYSLFVKQRQCAACGLEGRYFFLEQQQSDKSPHFNFYGEKDGEYVLMTKDHIRPRVAGGPDEAGNYQTMCAVCNNIKAHYDLDLETVRELRRIYDECPEKGRNRNRVVTQARRQLCSSRAAHSDTAPRP
jgi:hypothetical protein